MQGIQLKEILKIFYTAGASALPVVKTLDDGNEILCGFILRSALDRELSDMARSDIEYKTIPDHLISVKSDKNILKNHFEKYKTITVISDRGLKNTEWNETEFLIAYSKLEKDQIQHKETASIQNEGSQKAAVQNEDSGDAWLAKLILSNLSHPLFAAGLKGETLFYNQAFEDSVLKHPFFNHSISNLELYFLELIRDTLGKHALKGLSTENFTAAPDQLPFIIDVATLEQEKKVYGYLFLFRDSDKIIEEISTLASDSGSYQKVIDGVESGIILKTIEKNKFNISHTAEELQLKRSTLQNRIKLLKLENPIKEKKLNLNPLKSSQNQEPKKNKKIESTNTVKKTDRKKRLTAGISAKKGSVNPGRKK